MVFLSEESRISLDSEHGASTAGLASRTLLPGRMQAAIITWSKRFFMIVE
jgi:hypothetical protein